MRVCLLTEGTYPFVRGGVSTWCHDLVAGLPEIEFTIYALVGNPGSAAEYALPPNVTKLVAVPLYGHQGLREYNGADLGGGGRRKRSARALRDEFLPRFEQVLEQIVLGMEHASPHALADALAGCYAYFREHDYDWTMRRREVWAASLAFFRREPWHAQYMSSLEAVELVRSLYRYFIPLAIELPEADVYHSSASGLSGIVAMIANRAGRRTLLTEHGIYLRERVLELARSGFPFSDRTLKKNFFSAIARATYASCDAIAPVCAYNTRWENFYGVDPARVRVVYNGVDETRFADRDLDPERPTVAAVLRIDPLKDVPTMIASAATVRATIPDAIFKIWGPAPDPDYFALCKGLVARLGLEETVRFMGPTKDPASAYADAHVVALSSISEGFPYTIIEAMMSAKPVVATDVGGVREAVDRFGTVVPPKNPQRLGAALAALLADPAGTRRLGKEARAFALERFTQRTFLEQYRALYAEGVAPRLRATA
jgi:glycosyltransferase involved in cell wall biosynthesis